MENKVSLWYLVKVFLFIGVTAFGGYTALVAIIRKRLVEQDRVLDDRLIMDSITLASVLPGPLAVNITTYIGFYLKGWAGALLSMAAVLFPSVLLMMLLAEFQSNFNEIGLIAAFLEGVLPVIAAIIFSVAFKMAKKNIKTWWQWVIFLATAISAFLLKGYIVFIITIVLAGFIGLFLGEKETSKTDVDMSKKVRSAVIGVVVIAAAFLLISFLWGEEAILLNTFSKVSLTLFGGGYVMIPVLHDLVVEQNQWLASSEFAQAIAFGQITPGPILVSATFVGYKVSGILGALVATVGIFLPSALLIILVGVFYQSISGLAVISKLFKGISPAIIGFIVFSISLIIPFNELDWFAGLVLIVSAVAITKFNINFFWLMLIFGTGSVLLDLFLSNS
ncbi:MAG: chromate efflux transporter [Cytophagales bacterium]|nr:chromate efflux transporter [Cytophagales bacterium]